MTNRTTEVLRLAARLRNEHYRDATLLAWDQLTDAQKVPWILRANDELPKSSYCSVCLRDLSGMSSQDCPCRKGKGFAAWETLNTLRDVLLKVGSV